MKPPRCPEHDWCPAHNCGACRSDRLAANAPETATPLVLTPEQREANARGARIVRAALEATKESR